MATPAWHALDVREVTEELSVDPTKGLSPAEIQTRRAEHGENRLPREAQKSAVLQLLRQLADPLVGALLVAAVVAAIVASTDEQGSWADAIAILLIVALNAILGFVQERRAEAALAALEQMTSPRAKALRDGRPKDIDAAELVPGDIVLLEAGDAVPADGRLVQSAELALVEAALTGESVPVEKRADAVFDEATPLADRQNMVFTGTTVARGTGRVVVASTGAETELGRIGTMLSETEREPTPLEKRLDSLGKWILVVCVAISVLVFVIGFFSLSLPWPTLLLIAVSLAVAAIPEGLPAITTITLALGMQRMARKGAIIRKLPAVETLGSATIICSDKTGTLTQNAMTVREVETLDERFEVTGEGLSFDGRISRPSGEDVRAHPPPLAHLLRVAVLCNDTAIEQHDQGPKVVGDPTEAALVSLGEKAGMRKVDLEGDFTELRRNPFDSNRRMMSVVWRHADGTELSMVKGSADVLLARSRRVLTLDGVRELDEEEREQLRARNEELASRAYRVLAYAEKEDPGDDPEDDLTFLGLTAMIDPPRPEVEGAVAECREAGIRVAMITGDHEETAVAIARELGFWSDDAVAVTGAEINGMSDAELTEMVRRVKVFARVTADQKLRIVRALEAAGHVVAMTGDGVNDAPALKEAAIGVAMGRMGTDVARQAAAMVLADDNFATIVAAVREGRAIFRNIQKFIFFLGSSNAGLVVAVVIASFFDWMPQLTPLQLLWINLVTNGLPALALGVDPPEQGQMQEGPRPPGSGIVSLRDLFGVLLVGFVMGGAALGVYGLVDFWPELFGGATREDRLLEARTMAFALLALSPLFHAHNCRSPVHSIFRVGLFSNRFLWLAIGISASLQLLACLIPALQPIFLTQTLSLAAWAVVVALAMLPIPVVEVAKRIAPVFTPRAESPGPGSPPR